MTIPFRIERTALLILILAACIGWENKNPVSGIEAFCVAMLIRIGFTGIVRYIHEDF